MPVTATISMPDSGNRTASPTVVKQPVLSPWIRAQAINLERHALALRPFTRDEFGTSPEMPTEGHIQAVNTLIGRLSKGLHGHSRNLKKLAQNCLANPSSKNLAELVELKHRAHSRVLEIEKVWDFYLELFGQRQSRYGSWLRACDRIALDCYQTAYTGLGEHRTIPAPAPFSYMKTGFGPATYRRRIPLTRLGRQLNPFPLVQLPYHRLVNPWTLGAVLHEVSHNLQSDLSLSRVVPQVIQETLTKAGFPAPCVRAWVRWNRETFADLAALLLGGPAVIASLMDVVGRSADIVFNYDENGVHPVPYLRVFISCELARRLGFSAEATAYAKAWSHIYPDPRRGTIPPVLVETANQVIPAVVEAICFRRYAELGNRALSEVIRFARKEQTMIEEAAIRLAAGTDPGIVPARYLIGAARIAFDRRLAPPKTIREQFFSELARS